MSTYQFIKCPQCGYEIKQYKNPTPTVDIIIEVDDKIVLIERKNPPHGWAIPGGFVDYGEALIETAIREAKEETGLDVEIVYQMATYSDPKRDPRGHTISTVYIARAKGEPKGGDDAKTAKLFDPKNLPTPMCFDHKEIIEDYLEFKHTGKISRLF